MFCRCPFFVLFSFFFETQTLISQTAKRRPVKSTLCSKKSDARLWTMRYGACSSNASTIAGFATATTRNSVSSRSGVASTRTSLTEQFDSGVFD